MRSMAHAFAGRVAMGLCSLSAAVAMALSYAADVGAACNQVCTDGNSNTFFGVSAGISATGTINTGFGVGALSGNLTGGSNTAIGDDALASDTSGSNNTASGTFALIFDTSGSNNTAAGSGALFENDAGNENTADGASALGNNTSGSDNTATGYQALLINTTGNDNTADGSLALARNSTGAKNTAIGEGALQNNVSGTSGTAVGRGALNQNSTGGRNVGIGQHALYGNTTGHNNIGIGVNAGDNLTTGSNNIEIGSEGAVSDGKTIRIGESQTATYIAGIGGAAVTGADVVINASGRLGIVASSARYKHDIRDMGATSDGLMKLRPVTFKYNDDRQGTRQYGLVAEEVERIYPELVTYGADGRVETVRYSMLTSMLLNQVQRAERERLRQDDSITRLSRELAETQVAARNQATEFARRLAALERAMAARDTSRAACSAAP